MPKLKESPEMKIRRKIKGQVAMIEAQNDLTAEEMAAVLGVSKNAYWKKMHDANFSFGDLCRLSARFGLTFEIGSVTTEERIARAIESAVRKANAH